MKKIRFFINTLGGGGAEKVLLNLIKQLDDQEFDITLVTVSGGVRKVEVPTYVKYKQIVQCKNIALRKFFSKVVQKLPKRLVALFFLKGRFDFEVAYLEGFSTRLMAVKKTSGKKIAFVHCNLAVDDMLKHFYPNRDACLREYNKFSQVCFVSCQGLRSFEQVYGRLNNSRVIHNALDIEGIKRNTQQNTELRYTTEGLKLVAVGRLTKVKAFARLLSIAMELEKKYSFELWIVGDGEERKSLENMISENGMKSVKLLGYHENPYPYIKQADLFVCSSYSEGYSTAVTEALVLGIPVLTTDCAGMDEILDCGKFGMIVENSEEGLRTGLERLLNDKKLYDQYLQKARWRSISMTTERAISEYLDLFSVTN